MDRVDKKKKKMLTAKDILIVIPLGWPDGICEQGAGAGGGGRACGDAARSSAASAGKGVCASRDQGGGGYAGRNYHALFVPGFSFTFSPLR